MSQRSAESFPLAAPLHFADEREADRFIETLARFERGEITEADWRAFCRVNGSYGQRNDPSMSMLRAKIPQGILDAAQLGAVADVADRFSRRFCHVTTRQNFQFHFVPLSEIGDAMRMLAREGITTREACGNAVRNITAGPTTGIAADEVFDVEPYARAMTRYLLRHPLSGVLPRKFKIAFTGGGRDHAFAAINDIGWHARVRNGRRGFLVTVAGGTAVLCRSGECLFEFLPAGEILALSEAVLRVFHRLGDHEHRHKNRLKFLVKDLGWGRFRDEVFAELERVRTEGLPPLPFDPEQPRDLESPPALRGPHPSLDDLSALTNVATRGPGLHPRQSADRVSLPVVQETSREFAHWRATNVSAQKQHGFEAVTITLPLGDVTSGQLRAVARLTEAYADGRVRLTTSQNLLLHWVPSHEIDSLYAALRVCGLATPDAYSLADVVSCPGAETCNLAVTHSRGVARLVSEHFEGRSRDVKVHISGCPNGCGLHHVAGIGFQGGMRKLGSRTVPQYFVYVGGGIDGPRATFGRVVAKVPARRVPQAVDRLLALADAHALPGERPEETWRRLDLAAYKQALADLETLSEADATEEDFA